MAIDMSTVKEIHYNNKEIIKIQDSNQNILWQKVSEPNYLFYINGSALYRLDMKNKVLTSLTSPFSSGQAGNHVIAFNNKLYWVNGTTQREITISGDTISVGTVGSYLNISSNLNGNYSYKLPNSTDIYFNYRDYATTKLTAGNVESTVTFTNDVRANNVCSFNGKQYGTVASGTTIFEYSNNDWVVSTMSQLPSQTPMYDVWTVNGRVFLDHLDSHYEYNSTTNTWDTHTWNGSMGAFTGARVFRDGEDIYQVGGTGMNANIYKLDLSTDTWTLYWTLSSSIRGDYFIDKNGTCQMGQNMRPRLDN